MKKKKLFLGLSVLAGAVVLASCTVSQDNTTTTSKTNESTTTTTVAEKNYTVTWKNADGSVLKTDTAKEGTVASYDGATPTKASDAEYSYTFKSWDKDLSAVNADVVYTAVYESTKNKYTYTFYDEDGTTELKKITVEYGTQISAPTSPEKQDTAEDDYTFDGWYDAKTGGNKVTSFSTITGNVSYYARYTSEKNKYTYTFYDENGTSVLGTNNVAYGTQIEVPANPTKAADDNYFYIFEGWYDAKEGGKKVESFGTVSGNVSYYARYTQKAACTIIFYNEDGTDVLDTKKIAEGSQIVAPTDPTKQEDDNFAYSFDGWYDAATGGNKVTTFGTASGNASYYARFNNVAKYYVTFYDEDGVTPLDSKKVAEGTQIVAPNNPTKTADAEYIYTFDGWYDAATDGNKVTEFGTVDCPKSYYARFNKALKITVSFVVDGTSYGEPQVIATGSKATKPADPSKTGFDFVYWTLDGTTEFDFDTVLTSNTELTAYFEETAEMENVGFGTSYTAWTTLFSSTGSTRVDNKERKYLGVNDDDAVSMNGFTFKGKAVLDSNVMNTNGTTFSVVIPNNKSSLTMNATWGSSTDVGVIRVYKNGASTPIYESSSTYSKENSSISLELTGLSAGTYEIKAEKTNTTGTAGLKISTIFYSKKVEYVNVSYVLNNGESKTSDRIKKGTKLQKLPTLIRSGFKFDGWYTTQNYDDGSEFNIDNVIDSSITLYAKWEELTPEMLVTVSFDINVSGYSIPSIDIEKGTKLQELPTLDIPGYRFNKWFTDSSKQTVFNIDTFTFDNAATIYGEYIKVYTVTFLDNDGNVIESNTVTVDEDTLITSTITKPYISGYKFDYWYNVDDNQQFNVATDKVNSDLLLRAHYSVDENPVDKLTLTSAEGIQEAAYITFNEYSLDSTKAESYNVYLDNKKLASNQLYISKTGTTVRADIFGLTKGNHSVTVTPVVSGEEIYAAQDSAATLKVQEYDRSGYAHFNYDEGVGAYNNDGTLKDKAIVLYVTDDNKNTVTLEYKGKTVSGIGNILNSVGQACGEAGHENECKKVSSDKVYYGKGNTNQGILLDLAKDNVPLVVRFIGCVSNSGLYQPGTYNANSTGLIQGLTSYDSVDYGGSEGDNGHMARMKSAKNITFEGVGDNAAIDGWGFHLICETAYPELAKNFEVRNLTFMNTPEDAIGMEGQETESTLTITASVERCWVHHNTFLAPKIGSPAESDKSEGDGSCDFKRGRFFTCSYNYFENCHKTNLVGSSKTSVQYNMSYHHNIWYNCAARQPLARRGNIHFYNNLIIGTTDTVSSLRADAYMFAEGNYYMGCSRPVEYKAEGSAGVCKAYDNNLVGCYNAFDATVATSRDQAVSSNCKDNATNTSYANFDTNSELFYYDSVNKKSDCYLTDPNQARLDCLAQSGSRYRTVLNSCVLKTTTDVTSVASSATISGADSLTIGKAKGVIKVFTVTSPVTITIAATSNAGFDTGYLLKKDGSLVLKLTESVQSAVLENGVYVIASSVSFSGANGKNDKETTVTKCEFAPYDSTEFNEKMIANFNAAKDSIPSNISYNDECYNAIYNAMTIYSNLGTLQSEVDYSPVLSAYNQYKSLGVAYVEAEIDKIVTPVTTSNSSLVINARTAYNSLIQKASDASVSNLAKLASAETEMFNLAVDIFLAQVDAIPTEITYTTECGNAISTAETAYNNLDEDQVKADNVKAAYSKLTAARAKYNSLEAVANVNILISSANDLDSYGEALDAYNELSPEQKALVTGYSDMIVEYTILAIDSIGTVSSASGPKISLARSLYDSLSDSEKASVNNYSTLTAAEDAFSSTVQEYTKSWSNTSEPIKTTTGTTTDGFTYKSNKVDSTNGTIRIKNSNGDNITLSGINSSDVSIVVVGKLDDTSSSDVGYVKVTYADGTSENFEASFGASHAITTSNISVSNGKTVSSISFIGNPSLSKNFIITNISVTYKK